MNGCVVDLDLVGELFTFLLERAITIRFSDGDSRGSGDKP